MLTPLNLHLLCKIHIISMILYFCILERIQELFLLLNHCLWEGITLLGQDRWEKSLIANNKLGFIDGSLTISSPLVNSPTTAQAWIRANNMVGTWIINSISPKLQASIIYRDTALEIWTDLRDTFSQGNGTKVFNIQK